MFSSESSGRLLGPDSPTAAAGSNRSRAISPAATGLVSSAHANALLTSMLTPRAASPHTGAMLTMQPHLISVGGFSSIEDALKPDTAAGAAAGPAGKAGFWQSLGTALRLNPAGGTPALRVTGGAALQGDVSAAAAAAPSPVAATAAMGGDDNSQAKPVYSSVMKGPSAASDLVLMCRRYGACCAVRVKLPFPGGVPSLAD
jgi:hypothetical protein